MRYKLVETHWDKDEVRADIEHIVEADTFELDGVHGTVAKFFRDGKLILIHRQWDWIELIEGH